MNGLEQRLHELGRVLEYPPEPDVVPAVLARLERPPRRRPFPWRPVAIAVAVVALAVAAAFAVPQARTAILRWFHLGGATVVRVETLPPARERSQAGGLGRPVSRAEAERQLGFRLVLPRLEGGAPKRVYLIARSLATVVLRAHGYSVLLSEFASSDAGLLKKLAAGATVIESVQLNGDPGLWLEGGPHTLTYFDRNFGFRQRTVLIRGNVLLWVHGRLTLRLEGELTKSQALEIARLTR